jgi:protein TonB
MKSSFIILFLLFFVPSLSFGQEDNKPITAESKPYKKEAFAVVDQQPEFHGGEEGLKKFYRETSKHLIAEEGAEGKTVYYQIVIDEKGKVDEFKILRGQSEELNLATEKLIKKMPKWKPGIKGEQPVRVVKNLSIKYAIE